MISCCDRKGQPRAFRLEVDLLKRQLYDRLRGLEILIRKLRQFHSRRQHKRAVDRRLGRSELRLPRAALSTKRASTSWFRSACGGACPARAHTRLRLARSG